jgi:hypothetical protein
LLVRHMPLPVVALVVGARGKRAKDRIACEPGSGLSRGGTGALGSRAMLQARVR